jgi:hypothetical protein
MICHSQSSGDPWTQEGPNILLFFSEGCPVLLVVQYPELIESLETRRHNVVQYIKVRLYIDLIGNLLRKLVAPGASHAPIHACADHCSTKSAFSEGHTY